jgi:hypothetical protein
MRGWKRVRQGNERPSAVAHAKHKKMDEEMSLSSSDDEGLQSEGSESRDDTGSSSEDEGANEENGARKIMLRSGKPILQLSATMPLICVQLFWVVRTTWQRSEL